MSSALDISVQIVWMICDVKDYQLLQSKLTELRPHHTETVWEEVGDLIIDWGEKQWEEGGRFHLQTLEKGGANPFETRNLLDFVMQVYEFAGESALLKKIVHQFELANVYSDQAGLSRKFELYETLIEESYPRIEKREGNDEMHYYFTRSLKRLAQLTENWKGEEESIQLWTRLAEYGLESSDEERMSILKEIEEKAPWFAYANPELFLASEKAKKYIEKLGGEVSDGLTKSEAKVLIRNLRDSEE